MQTHHGVCEPKTLTNLKDLVPGVASGQPKEGQHGGRKGQEVCMGLVLAQPICWGSKQVHPQDCIDEEHEEQQAAHIEDSWQGAQ